MLIPNKLILRLYYKEYKSKYIHLLIAWNAIWLGNHGRRIPTSFFVADVTDNDEQNIHKYEYDLKNEFMVLKEKKLGNYTSIKYKLVVQIRLDVVT